MDGEYSKLQEERVKHSDAGELDKDSRTDKEITILRKLVKELYAMDKTLFDDFKQSLKQASSIRRRKHAPFRVTEISAPDAKSIRAKVG